MDATAVTSTGDGFEVRFQGTNPGGTQALTAGMYTLTVFASNAATKDRITVAQFPVRVLPDMSTGTPALLHAVKMLPIVEAEIEARLTGNGSANEEYGADSVHVKKLPMQQLQVLRNKYAAEVNQIMNPNGQIARVKFVMSPAGGMPDLRRRND